MKLKTLYLNFFRAPTLYCLSSKTSFAKLIEDLFAGTDILDRERKSDEKD